MINMPASFPSATERPPSGRCGRSVMPSHPSITMAYRIGQVDGRRLPSASPSPSVLATPSYRPVPAADSPEECPPLPRSEPRGRRSFGPTVPSGPGLCRVRLRRIGPYLRPVHSLDRQVHPICITVRTVCLNRFLMRWFRNRVLWSGRCHPVSQERYSERQAASSLGSSSRRLKP